MLDKAPLAVLRSYPPHDGTLWGLVQSRAAVRGDATFLASDGVELSWNAFRDRVQGTRRLLRAHGVRSGDRVGIMAANSADYVVILFATIAAGAISVPINPNLTVPEAQYIIDHAKPVLLFGSVQSETTLRAASHDIEPSPRILVLPRDLAGPSSNATGPDATAPEHGDRPADPDDTALILYTSGTTGAPKGVMHSQRSMIMAGEYFVERLHLQPEDRMLCILPFFHINGLLYSLFGAAAAGATLIVAPRFSASTFWAFARQMRATEVNIIAAVGRILMRRPRSEFVADHGIRKLYGAPIPADVYETFRNEFGIAALIEGYGLTEAPGLCSNPFDGPHKVGSIGVPTPHPDPARDHAELKVVDLAGATLPRGETGELLVRTPIITQGYYRDPDATRVAFVDGWFRTGDLVRQEADGFFTFIGRQKDIIRRRGENVSGAEIDQVACQHPDIQDAAAIAVDSDLGEDDILLVAMRRPGAKVTESDLRTWCAQHLSSFKLPRYVTFVDSFPYTPSHRVAKHQLRADRDLKRRAIDFAGRESGARFARHG
ncbi:MAG: AMP-binding protein [Burkholderiales bacterium]|nr:AMP-binding protein [Burkholderiales bacterium]